MSETTVFFSRCRPQKADPVDLAVRERRLFIGWPAWRPGVIPRRGHLREAIIDLGCSDEAWAALCPHLGKNRPKYVQNRNLVRDVSTGAIALVPRPSRGVVYAGRVAGPFTLLDHPPWGEEYLQLRRDQGLDVEDELGHLADVAQGWEVDRFRALPFPLVPAWIRRSLFGRSTYGRIRPQPALRLDPHSVLDRLIDHPEAVERPWTTDPAEVERRLVNDVGPNAFEHLCAALLQLEHPEEVWAHVGGSGDGGVDGIGAGPDGRAVGLLQCKWSYQGEEVHLANPASRGAGRRILAALIHPEAVAAHDGVAFWSRHHIAALVVKHARRLPLAISLRVGAAGR